MEKIHTLDVLKQSLGLRQLFPITSEFCFASTCPLFSVTARFTTQRLLQTVFLGLEVYVAENGVLIGHFCPPLI